MQFLLIIALVTLVSNVAISRPVSYPGGVTVMQFNDMDRHSLHVHYSPTAKYSIGYKGILWEQQDWQFHGAQLNYLVKRWNRFASQANFYFKSGFGWANSELDPADNTREPAAFTGIATDWETRRYFIAYENQFYFADNIENFYTQKARIGIAPYIGDYGDLHTWLMLQVEANSEAVDGMTTSAVVRLFKSTYLVEAGVNENSDLSVNFIIRF